MLELKALTASTVAPAVSSTRPVPGADSAVVTVEDASPPVNAMLVPCVEPHGPPLQKLLAMAFGSTRMILTGLVIVAIKTTTLPN